MVIGTPTRAAVVVPTASAISALTPLGGPNVRLTSGFWDHRLRTNRKESIPHGYRQLEEAGNRVPDETSS